jgi:SIR2-like domain
MVPNRKRVSSSAPVPRSLPEELVKAVKERRTILFAGAGLSMSVGLPSWQQFIDRMGQELGVDADDLLGPGTSYHTLAEYYRIKHGSIGPLRSWMDRHWRVPEEKARASKMHEIIVALEFPIIYTTNYDRNIEAAFAAHGREYVKIATARDIAKTRDGVAQIVKFHGDFDEDDSLIVTETDYFNRLAFDSPLDIKFLADALGKTVLFIGYSMTDLNIRLLLHNLWRSWQNSGYGKDRPPSFVFMARPNPLQEAILEQWGITALIGDTDDPEQALTQFLEELKTSVDGGESLSAKSTPPAHRRRAAGHRTSGRRPRAHNPPRANSSR